MSKPKEETPIHEQLEQSAKGIPVPPAKPTSVQCAVIAGIMEDGSFKFDVYGTDVNIDYLVGLNKLIDAEIKKRHLMMYPLNDVAKSAIKSLDTDIKVIKLQLGLDDS